MDQPLRETVGRHLRALDPGGSEAFALNRDGMLTLAFDGDREVTLEVPERGGTIFFHAPLIHLPAARCEGLLRRALTCNLFDVGRQNAWVALDAETSVLTLCATSPASDLEDGALAGCIAELVDCIGSLRSRLAADPVPPEAPPDRWTDLAIIHA